MTTRIEYECGEFIFEFTPEGAYTKGSLTVTTKEPEETFVLKTELTSQKSRQTFVNEARALYPGAFSDELELRRALNDFAVYIQDQQCIAQAKAEEDAEADTDSNEDDADVDESAAETLISTPGVLDRYVEAMAEVHEVYGDRPQMKVVALNGLSAQLKPLPDGKPLGTNAVLIGESGRGKNYVADAVASGMPDSFVYEFESASAKSFFYEAEATPGKFTHTWVYPNEAEATDALIETLRPLLSKAKAVHKTVDKDADGANAFKGLTIEGPITVTIPTIRNKLDGQLQTRMLVVELEEFEERVSKHSAKVSDTLLPDYATKDHVGTLALWKAALAKLIEIRRVVIPTKHENFKLGSSKVSHGARLWRNFLSLMLTNAWLEQRNREVLTLENGEEAVVAAAEDYRVAYEAFASACERSVVNLSNTHRNILGAVYELEKADKTSALRDAGFSLRKIAEKAGCSYETVRNHKTFLTQSVGLLRELENGGLRLIKDADSSWWEEGELLEGFPRADEVKEWWETQKQVDTLDSEPSSDEKPVDKPNEVTTEEIDDRVDMSSAASIDEVDEEHPIGTPNTNGHDLVSSMSTLFEGSGTIEPSDEPPAPNGSPNRSSDHDSNNPQRGETVLGTYEHNA
jgi:hypothetical protein